MISEHVKPFFLGAAVLTLTFALTMLAFAQGPSDFLRRIDENGNGMIDPEEMNGRSGFFLRRMAENNPRLDLSRPIPIDKLSEEFNRMREERGRGGGGPMFGPPGDGGPGGWSPGGGPPGGGFPGGGFPGGGGWPGSPPGGGWPGFMPPGGGWPGRGGDGRNPFDQSSPYSPRTTKVEPLVPGFGVATVTTPPPGFGAEAELFNVEVTDQDREEAARAFGRYDENRDGKIDAEEMRRTRYGSDLPVYDRNHDGAITLSEMEYRYARRRIENTRDAAVAGRSEGDRDRRRGDGRSSERRGSDGNSDSSDDKDDDRKSYRRKSPIERLPEGTPDWFARDDADGDGQIAMAEYSASWTETVMSDFNQFDLNRDGLITPREAVKATSNGAVRGGSIGSSSSSPAPAAAPPAATASSSTPAASSPSTPTAAAQPAASQPAEPIKVDPKYYEYFKKLVAKYDKNSDGVLTPDEWSSMSKSPEAADVDGDKRVTIEEYTRWSVQR